LYGDYVDQLTFLLLAPSRSGFAQRLALPVSAALRHLKMADEQVHTLLPCPPGFSRSKA
jgi:hypothetical protein